MVLHLSISLPTQCPRPWCFEPRDALDVCCKLLTCAVVGFTVDQSSGVGALRYMCVLVHI